jgi:hypothetical protein
MKKSFSFSNLTALFSNEIILLQSSQIPSRFAFYFSNIVWVHIFKLFEIFQFSAPSAFFVFVLGSNSFASDSFLQ